jgi:hypothetical protein
MGLYQISLAYVISWLNSIVYKAALRLQNYQCKCNYLIVFERLSKQSLVFLLKLINLGMSLFQIDHLITNPPKTSALLFLLDSSSPNIPSTHATTALSTFLASFFTRAISGLILLNNLFCYFHICHHKNRATRHLRRTFRSCSFSGGDFRLC